VVAGWEVIRSRFGGPSNSPYGGSSSVSAIDPDRGHWSSPDPTVAKSSSRTTQHAFYLEDAWQFQDRWLLLAGIRRDLSDHKRHEFFNASSFTQKLGGTAWRLGLTFRLNEGTSLYGQVSQGHDPVTNMLSMNLANRDFKLTTARQVEVGIKQQIGQGLGEWTAAAYRIEKDNIITRDPERPMVSVQGGKQHSQGLELSAMLRPHRDWRVEGNYALVDAKFDSLFEADGADRSGNRPANVPRQAANLWVHYQNGGWQASLGARHVGKRFANNANTSSTPAYTVFDAALAWQMRPGATLRLTGRNLANKVYSQAAISGTRVILGEGRRFDLTAEFKF
jgi:iron complex outermembrane receptor protein